jgi:hypothetical protein
MTTKEEILSEDEEIASLFPEPVSCQIGKLTIMITPMNLETCISFMSKARPIITPVLQSGASTVEDVMPLVLAAAADHKDAFVEALALGIGRTPRFVGKLPWPAAISLAATIFTVNMDFFIQSVGTLAPDVMAILKEKAGIAGVGLTH